MSDLVDKDGHLLPHVREDLEAMGFDEESIDLYEEGGWDEDQLIYYETEGWSWDAQDRHKYLK